MSDNRIKVYKLRSGARPTTPGGGRWRWFPGPDPAVNPWVVDSPNGILHCRSFPQATKWADEIADYQRAGFPRRSRL